MENYNTYLTWCLKFLYLWVFLVKMCPFDLLFVLLCQLVNLSLLWWQKELGRAKKKWFKFWPFKVNYEGFSFIPFDLLLPLQCQHTGTCTWSKHQHSLHFCSYWSVRGGVWTQIFGTTNRWATNWAPLVCWSYSFYFRTHFSIFLSFFCHFKLCFGTQQERQHVLRKGLQYYRLKLNRVNLPKKIAIFIVSFLQ